MIEIEKPRIETAVLSEDGRYGKFVIEPLERGFGITLGNSMRRILLSSLPDICFLCFVSAFNLPIQASNLFHCLII